MTLYEKIDFAREIIRITVGVYKTPIVYSSFGKDSMVLLDLIKTCGFKYPIMFHREPFCPDKYAFANEIIRDNDYSVYDYPPNQCSVIKNGGALEIVNWQQIGGRFAYMPTGIDNNDRHPRLCALHDIFLKPKCREYIFPWDVCFIGHKRSDVDPILGPIPYEHDIKVNPGSSDFCYPIADFTDEDIWAYTEEHELPIHHSRYDANNGWKEFEDKTHNPDYFPACTSCIDRDALPVVWCERVGMKVTNIGLYIPYSDPKTIDQGPGVAK